MAPGANQVKLVSKLPLTEWNKTAESQGFRPRHICAAKTYGRSVSPICPWVKAEHCGRQVTCTQHCAASHGTPYSYGQHPDLVSRLAGAVFRMAVPVSSHHLCFIFVKNEHYVTGVVVQEDAQRLVGYFHMYLDPSYLAHIWHGSISPDGTCFALLVKDVTNMPGTYNLHLFQADAPEETLIVYRHVQLVQNLTCFLNGGMKVLLVQREPDRLAYALVPVLEGRKMRAVLTDWHDPAQRHVTRDLNEFLALGDLVTSDWSIQNLVASPDGGLLLVCIEELCIHRRTDGRQKRGRLILLSSRDLSALCSLSTHLHTDYWWNLETFGCFTNVTPGLSRRGYQIALYTQMSGGDRGEEEEGSQDYILVYSLPLLRANLRWACRKTILSRIDPKHVDLLELPTKLKHFLKFETHM